MPQCMVDAECIHSHAGELFSLVDHKAGHLGVCQVELGKVAEVQERDELIAVFFWIEEPVAALAAVLKERLLKDGCLVPAMVGHEVADDLQSLVVGLVEQLLIILPTAEVRVDFFEIQSMISMIVCRLEDRRKHDGRESQVLDIVKFLNHSL